MDIVQLSNNNVLVEGLTVKLSSLSAHCSKFTNIYVAMNQRLDGDCGISKKKLKNLFFLIDTFYVLFNRYLIY